MKLLVGVSCGACGSEWSFQFYVMYSIGYNTDNGIDYDDEEFRRMVKAEEERLMREEGDRIRKEAEKVWIESSFKWNFLTCTIVCSSLKHTKDKQIHIVKCVCLCDM